MAFYLLPFLMFRPFESRISTSTTFKESYRPTTATRPYCVTYTWTTTSCVATSQQLPQIAWGTSRNSWCIITCSQASCLLQFAPSATMAFWMTCSQIAILPRHQKSNAPVQTVVINASRCYSKSQSLFVWTKTAANSIRYLLLARLRRLVSTQLAEYEGRS